MERSEPFVLQPGEARPNSRGGEGYTTAFKLVGRDTGGAFSLLEWALQPCQEGPGLHQHNFDEAFYILSGQVRFRIGETSQVLGPGQLAWMPRNTPHSFSNAGPETATGLTVSTPGGLETVFDALRAGQAPPAEFRLQRLGPAVNASEAC
ncbi:cupin domain-containing protein [Micromonospora rifamycinica]|uniref:Cupin domain protein n=1 Tax=Micromonospora rifamycinica TaxID=291594 RepID=A0A1C5HMH5_9ACTN|nr:cupin domain-containing protein [Micromonospora rifamycinica]SCG47117.1 Cupin domain protein [Micromonospora rifamycinica]